MAYTTENHDLTGKNVAILIANGFEQEEMTRPRKALEDAGARTHIISTEADEVKGWQHGVWGDSFPIDVHISDADAQNYDALLVPGGVMNPDYLRRSRAAVAFVWAFFEMHKPVASICHGPWMLAEADVARGRTMTSHISIKTDLVNAGAQWVDEEVVVDHGLVTSRGPDDIPAFNAKMIEEIAEGKHEKQHV